jgi:hypothetical protein
MVAGKLKILSTALLGLIVGAQASCSDSPWDEEPPFRLVAEMRRGGLPIASADLSTVAIRFVLRADVFRPLDFTPRGHRQAEDCRRDRVDDQTAPPPSSCEDLTRDPAGRPLDVALAAGPTAYLQRLGGVLEVMQQSDPRAPLLFDDVAVATALAETTFTGHDRYWNKYWSICKGCLGLVWVEALVQTEPGLPSRRICTKAIAPAPADTKSVRIGLDLDDSTMAETPSPAQDSPPCGERSWFEGIHYDLAAHDHARVLRFRP